MVTYEGTIVNHDSTFKGQIEVGDDGLIKQVVNLDKGEKRVSSIDDVITFSTSTYIMPGMVDVHDHPREDQTGKHDHKENYLTASNAALHGGVVAYAAMPNQTKPLTTQEDFDWHTQKIASNNHPVVTVNYVGIGTDTEPLEGDYIYKLFTGPSVGTLFFKTKEELGKALEKYRGKNISFHVEDYDVLEASKNGKTHQERRPVKCVETALEYVLGFIEEYDLDAKLCHWSTADKSFDMIREHRKRMDEKNLGYNTTIEVSPLHLLFDADMLKENPTFWPYVQMNPSVQGEEHRLALIQGLREGFIDMIATDHAPHTLDEKFIQFAQFRDEHPGKTNEQIYQAMLHEEPELAEQLATMNGTSGAPWLDTYALVAIHLMTEHDFTPEDIARVTSYNPGKFLNNFIPKGLGKGFGKIKKGYQGSFTVLNMGAKTTVRREDLQTKCGWSPLEGRTFNGGIEAVIIKGKNVTNQFK